MLISPREEIYSKYWYFAAERQSIFYKKLNQELPPYTDDPILKTYKFCNAYRATDRVSQYLIKDVIYAHVTSPEDTLFRIFLFRLFNRIETWRELERILGVASLSNFNPELYSKTLSQIRSSGQPIYGNAFILCANKMFGYDAKHDNHLALLDKVFRKSRIAQQFLDAKSLEGLFVLLRGLPLIGDFMAYQIAIDFNYSGVINFNENDFTIAGPGAIRGIKKCFTNTNNYSGADVIKYMVNNQEKEFKRYDLNFQKLFGRPLHAIDCQGLFCETDKYTRVSNPELGSNRKKIKAKYVATPKPITYFLPPKWGINAQDTKSKSSLTEELSTARPRQ